MPPIPPQSHNERISTAFVDSLTTQHQADFISSTPVDRDVILACISHLDAETLALQAHLYATVLGSYDHFVDAYRRSKDISARTDSLFDQVELIRRDTADEETGVGPLVARAVREYDEASRDVRLNQALIAALEDVVAVTERIDGFHEHMREGRLSDAMRTLVDVDAMLSGLGTGGKAMGEVDWNRVRLVEMLRAQLADMREHMDQQLDDLLGRAVAFSAAALPSGNATPSSGREGGGQYASATTTVLSILPAIPNRPEAAKVTLPEVFNCLAQLGLLEQRMGSLKRNLMKYIINPLFKQSDASWRINVMSREEGDGAQLMLELAQDVSEEQDIFSTLETIYSFFDHYLFRFSDNHPSSTPSDRTHYAQLFGNLLLPDTFSLVITHVLAQSIPNNIAELKDFQRIAQAATSLEQRLFELGMLVQPATDDDEALPLAIYVQNVDAHFAIRRRDRLLDDARGIMVKEEYESEMVTEERVEVVEVVVEEAVTTVEEKIVKEKESDAKEGEKEPRKGKMGTDADGWGWENDGWEVDDDMVVQEGTVPQAEKEEAGTSTEPKLDDKKENGWEVDGDPIVLEPGTAEETKDSPEPKPAEPKPAEPRPIEPKPNDEHDGWGQAEGEVDWNATLDESGGDYLSTAALNPLATPSAPAPSSVQSHQPLPKQYERRTLVTYAITRTPRHVLSLLRDTLRDASQLHDHPASAARLYRATVDLLDMYRAVIPAYHRQTLESIPAVAMLFRNDCHWLSKEVLRLAPEFQDSITLPDGESLDYTSPAHRLESLGTTWFELQMRRQRDAALECLALADGFGESSTEAGYERCERAVLQVVNTVGRLAGALVGVLEPELRLEALGKVTDAVAEKVVKDVEELIDISETESHTLATLLVGLKQIEGQFEEKGEEKEKKDDTGRKAGGRGSSEIHRSTLIDASKPIESRFPTWRKLCKLIDLLELPFAEIMSRFRQRELLEFSTRELTRLVCALFADSALRHRNLQEIARGPPVKWVEQGVVDEMTQKAPVPTSTTSTSSAGGGAFSGLGSGLGGLLGNATGGRDSSFGHLLSGVGGGRESLTLKESNTFGQLLSGVASGRDSPSGKENSTFGQLLSGVAGRDSVTAGSRPFGQLLSGVAGSRDSPVGGLAQVGSGLANVVGSVIGARTSGTSNVVSGKGLRRGFASVVGSVIGATIEDEEDEIPAEEVIEEEDGESGWAEMWKQSGDDVKKEDKEEDNWDW